VSTWLRVRFGVVSTVALAVGGVVYNDVFRGGLFSLATQTHSGPFSQHVQTLDSIVPVLIVALLLVVWTYVLVGGATEERARRRVR